VSDPVIVDTHVSRQTREAASSAEAKTLQIALDGSASRALVSIGSPQSSA